MSSLVFLLEQLAPGLLILLGIALLLTLRRWLRARRALRATRFELEQELTRRARGDALVTSLLLLEGMLLLVGVQQVVVPALRLTGDYRVAPLVTDGQFHTPVPVFNPDTLVDASSVNLTPDDPALRVLATPTMPPTPVGTIVPNAPAAIGCEEEGGQLQIPANGMRVFEPVPVVGTAFMENFAYYRFELRGPATGGSFAVLEDHNQEVRRRGELGQFVPAFYEPGIYQFRLVVTNLENRAGPTCTVHIYLSEPLPTATPAR